MRRFFSCLRRRLRELFPVTLRDGAVTLAIFGAATVLSFLLDQMGGLTGHVSLLYVMAVFLISKYTNGYFWGTLGSFAGVLLTNYAFTYPYFAVNLTLTGYPITFPTMLCISVMTSTMVTRIKEEERLRLESERETMRANLLRAVSHDLRTPLTAIAGTTAALLESGDRIPPERQKELLRESHDDAEWLIRMVENLLSITRMNGGGAPLQKSPEAVEEIVSEAVVKLHRRFPQAKVAVSVPEALLLVPMDAMLIEQVLLNLLENAVLHGGRSDGIRIAVTREGGWAVFAVCDEGRGIPPAQLPHLFSGAPLRENEAPADGRRNMGIGLSVCLSIVKAHGGRMDAENRPGGGACFRFALPLEKGGDSFEAKDPDR